MEENFHQPFTDLDEETALRTILEGTATETGEEKKPYPKIIINWQSDEASTRWPHQLGSG